jgi:hypothetical protein
MRSIAWVLLAVLAFCATPATSVFAAPETPDPENCRTALNAYNQLSRASDDWYVEAFRKIIGVYPAEYKYENALEFCPKLLPLYRERVERQTAVVEAYNNFHRLCLKPEDVNRTEARGAGSNKAPAILENVKNVISLCERALAEKNNAEKRQ